MVRGIESVFKGKVVGKDLTKWGADAQLLSAELAKAKHPAQKACLSSIRVKPEGPSSSNTNSWVARRITALHRIHGRFTGAAEAAEGQPRRRARFQEYLAMVS